MRKPIRKNQDQPAAADRRAVIDRLEGRLYFAHLGHEVALPAAAASGETGLNRVVETYTFADHRRSRLIGVGA